MKKIISLLLTLAALLSAVVIPAEAAEISDKKMNLLAGLGIVNDMSFFEFKAESTVTKKSFYTSLYNIMSDDEDTDEKIISFMERYNIIIDEYTLRDNITREEALSGAVSMLGYTYRALSGEELINAATKMGLRKYVSGEMAEDITLGEAVSLLAGAIDTEMAAIEPTFNSSKGGYKAVKDITPLIYYRNIYYVRGTLNKNRFASIVDGTPAQKGYVQIGDEKMLAGTTNAGDYIGMPVEAYVQYDEDEDEGTILYIAPNEKYVDVTKVSAEDILNVAEDFTKVDYTEGGRRKSLKISAVVKVIFNGQNCTDYTKADLMPSVGSIELIDSDRDDTVDVINVKSYKTVWVNYTSSYSKTVVNKFQSPSSVELYPDKREIVIEKNGEAADFSAIKTNDVLLVAESRKADGITYVIASDSREEVFVSGADGEEELTGNGKTYLISPDYAAESKTANSIYQLPETGKNYTLYFDSFGNVAYAQVKSEKTYMYALRAYKDETDDRYIMKAYTLDGEVRSYKWAEKVKMKDASDIYNKDDYIYREFCTVDNSTGALKFVPELIRAEFNADGEIKLIERAVSVANEGDENKFTKYKMSISRIYNNANMTFGCDVYGNAETKVLIVPTDKTKTEDYNATNMSYFNLDDWYQVEAYDMDKYRTAPLIVYETNASMSVGRTKYLIKKISTELVDGEVRTALTCLAGGSEVQLVTEPYYQLPSGLKIGDIIQVASNAKGEIAHCTVFNRISGTFSKTYPVNTDATAIYKDSAFASGYVKEVGMDEGMILVDCGIEYTASFKIMPETACWMYDGGETDKVRLISWSDIEPGDAVFVFITWAKPEIIYVMRNVN